MMLVKIKNVQQIYTNFNDKKDMSVVKDYNHIRRSDIFTEWYEH